MEVCPEFWDMFYASVHKQNIPKVSKFTYLKGVLRGSASVAISRIFITDDNYDVAAELLKEKLQQLPTSSSKLNDIRYTQY